MPAREPSAKGREPARRASDSASAKKVKQLEATVKSLRAELAREQRRRKIETRMQEEARKARLRVGSQMKTLRDQGAKLAKQLQEAIVQGKGREQARQQAVTLIAELRAQLRSRSAELKVKSAELVKLAKESAERARTIIEQRMEHPEKAVEHGEETAPPSHETAPPVSTVEAGPPIGPSPAGHH